MKKTEHAIIVGGGISGLCAAGAISPYFDKVSIVENEEIPSESRLRKSVPQGYHNHSLLAGGAAALFRLFPRLEQNLVAAGANRLQMNKDVLEERLDLELLTIDYGYCVYTQTRPLLEFLILQEVKRLPNVVFHDHSTVKELLFDTEKQQVMGVSFYNKKNDIEYILRSDFVILATGNDQLLNSLFNKYGLVAVKQSFITVDMGYSSAYYKLADNIPYPWRAILTGPGSKESSKGAILYPMEDNKYVLGLTARGEEKPPTTETGIFDFLQSLCTQTIYDVVKNAQRISEIKPYRFKISRLNHYNELESFPARVLPLGDAISRVNPIYGQGITVSALEAVKMAEIFEACTDLDEQDLHQNYFDKIWPVVSSAWNMAAIKDFEYTTTVGERPGNYKSIQNISRAMEKLLTKDPGFARLSAQVLNFLQPPESLNNPEVMKKLLSLEKS